MQFRDLKAQYQILKPEIDAGILEVIESSAFILGKPVADLEKNWQNTRKDGTASAVPTVPTPFNSR